MPTTVLDEHRQNEERSVESATERAQASRISDIQMWILGSAAVLVLLVIIVLPEPRWAFVAPSFERLETVTKILTPLILLVGVLAALRRIRAAENQANAALQQAQTAEDGHITGRFTKAIEQLGKSGDENLAVRLGGIYALERIAKDSVRDHWTVMEVLCAFLRETFPRTEAEEADRSWRTRPTDKQAICTVLKRRANREEPEGLDLLRTDLVTVNLSGAKLAHASLGGVDLLGANLEAANLSNANLGGANLRATNLARTDLSDAVLFGNCLSGANLREAKLRSTNLAHADLTRADLTRADLTGADLTGADLTGADLTGADLTGADLTGADLTGADLRSADLQGAKGLTRLQIDSAIVNPNTQLPKKFAEAEEPSEEARNE